MRKIEDIPDPTCSIIISLKLHERLKDNAANGESYQEIITRLLDFYEQNNTRRYTYD